MVFTSESTRTSLCYQLEWFICILLCIAMCAGVTNTTFGSMHMRVCSPVGAFGMRLDVAAGEVTCTLDDIQVSCKDATQSGVSLEKQVHSSR